MEALLHPAQLAHRHRAVCRAPVAAAAAVVAVAATLIRFRLDVDVAWAAAAEPAAVALAQGFVPVDVSSLGPLADVCGPAAGGFSLQQHRTAVDADHRVRRRRHRLFCHGRRTRTFPLAAEAEHAAARRLRAAAFHGGDVSLSDGVLELACGGQQRLHFLLRSLD